MDKEITRQEQIRQKGFDMFGASYSLQSLDPSLEYRKIKVSIKSLENAILDLANYKDNLPTSKFVNKPIVYAALARNDLNELRKISNLYYRISGMYQRICDYFAFLYRYDWYVTPEIYDPSAGEKEVLKNFFKILNYFDSSQLKKMFGEIALEVIKSGCYYGYIIDGNDNLTIQQLPAEYCRSRYFVGGNPAVEFNMAFFDSISNEDYRKKILNLFPEEFKKGYDLYKKGKLLSTEDELCLSSSFFSSGWYLLDPENTVKFNFKNTDIPIFVSSIPSMIDLEAAQHLDRKKQMQNLLKIIVQKLPRDKNGDLIFDVDEAADIHNNAVQMLKHNTVGTDVLTTFTDVETIDLSDKNTTTSQDDLQKVERTVYNNLGVSRNLFNTEGNFSLEKSILNDESTVRNLLLQFNAFLDRIIKKKKPNKKYGFKIYLLETTQYNYQTLSKMYKEQTQIGYSKMLPQIALGHSQSFILNTLKFENEVLHLSEIMIPPLMSSTLNGEDILGKKNSNNSSNSQNSSEGNIGRPEKEDDQKSKKTIQNIESRK